MKFVLCADDYGITRGVSEAILSLAQRGRLSATSALVTTPAWSQTAAALRELGTIDRGLHLALTGVPALGPPSPLAPDGRFPSLGRVLRQAFSGQLDPALVEEQFRRQLDAFVRETRELPDFIDGHQHVHLLPGVRQAVIRIADEIAEEKVLYLRSCWDSPASILRRGESVPKSLFLAALSQPLRWRLHRLGLAQNRHFRGVTAFDRARDFGAQFRRFLQDESGGLLIMCHPGPGDDPDLAVFDEVIARRGDEWAYLTGAQFPSDLQAGGHRLTRFHELETPLLASSLASPCRRNAGAA